MLYGIVPSNLVRIYNF